MKKKLIFIFITIACLNLSFLLINNVNAYQDVLNRIDIDVYINKDGDAHFTEKWTTEVGSGTENYKVFNNMGKSKIINFSVIDEDKHQFTYLSSWDVHKSRNEKEYKCGIIERNDSYELCWGVGQYGHREYTIQYTITNFIQQYQNDQGFNYAFLSDMDLPPRKVSVKVSGFTQFTDETCDIYAFGFDGDVQFNNGNVVIESSHALSSYSKVQLLMRMDNGMFPQASPNGQDYEDILEDATRGSDYVNERNESQGISDIGFYSFVFFILILPFVLYIVVLVAIIVTRIQGKDRRKNLSMTFEDQSNASSIPKDKDIDMYRDIPCQKDIYYFYYIALCTGMITNNQKAGLIAAILLQWVKEKQIEFIKTEDKGLIFKKEGYAINLNVPIQTKCSVEDELLNMLGQAAGKNGILETNEFEKWCKRNYSKVDIWFDRVYSYVESSLIMQGLLNKKRVPYKILFFTHYQIQKIYAIQFREEIKHVKGFKKFLKEMSSIDEKEVIEVKLWEEYLIFATILGIADEVESQLKIRCPEFNEYSHMDTIHTTRIMRDFTYRSVTAAYKAQSSANSSSRSSGGGGHSSSSGGGSSYSGGGGGGRR